MTPEQKIKLLIILKVCEWRKTTPPELTSENIDNVYEEQDMGCDDMQDARNELREGEVETGLKSKHYSRHYESKEVAAKLPDGSWVGWTYWSGGGKHGEPESIGWMDDAYDLSCIEEEKVVTVQTFSKVDPVSP